MERGEVMAEDKTESREDEPQPNPEHLAILMKGVAAWNKWREENPNVIPDLQGADLSEADLANAELSDAKLANAYMPKANLKNANLKSAILVNATLGGAHLENANLENANLENAQLVYSHLKNAKLQNANLKNADLMIADMENVNLSDGHLENALLLDANLKNASLNYANLRNAVLADALLENTDLRNTTGLRLDSTLIKNAHFSARASDPWSILRRSYTGPRIIFNILMLTAFMIPYVAKTAGWVGINHIQEEVKQCMANLQSVADKLEIDQHAMAKPMQDSLTAINERLPSENKEGWRKSSVWRLIIGLDKGWTFWGTALALIAYNFCRGLLTWIVAPMRDAEERSGFSPRYRIDGRGPNGKLLKYLWRIPGQLTECYGWLIWPHRFVSALFIFAVGSFVYHAYQWLMLPLTIPA